MKTPKRVALIFLGLLIILWLAFTIFAQPVLKSRLSQKLKRLPEDSISFGSLNLTFFPLGIKAKDVYFDLLLQSDSTLMQWKGTINHISVGGINWYKALKKTEFDVKAIHINEGSLNWVSSEKYTPAAGVDETSSETMPPILLRHVELKDILLSIPHDSISVQMKLGTQINNLTLTQQDSLKWDIESVVFTSTKAHFENLIVDYDLAYASLCYDSQDSLLELRSFSMKPRISREDFVKKYPYRKVQPSLTLNRIDLSGINPSKITKGIFAHVLLIDSCAFEIYQDIRLERPNVRKPMPSELIAKAPFPLSIDSLIVQNANLKYLHRPQQENLGLAHLSIGNIDLRAFPISNIGHSECADLNLEIAAILDNRPRLRLEAEFLPDSKHHNFNVNLSMSSTELGAFNEILYPTTGLKIKEGYSTGAKIHMTGNDYSVQGYLDIAYTNLRVALPPDQKGDLKFFKRSLESLGNFAVINNNNEMGNKRGDIFYKRPAKEPFVNFWWKGIEGGLLDVITPFYSNPDKKKK